MSIKHYRDWVNILSLKNKTKKKTPPVFKYLRASTKFYNDVQTLAWGTIALHKHVPIYLVSFPPALLHALGMHQGLTPTDSAQLLLLPGDALPALPHASHSSQGNSSEDTPFKVSISRIHSPGPNVCLHSSSSLRGPSYPPFKNSRAATSRFLI